MQIQRAFNPRESKNQTSIRVPIKAWTTDRPENQIQKLNEIAIDPLCRKSSIMRSRIGKLAFKVKKSEKQKGVANSRRVAYLAETNIGIVCGRITHLHRIEDNSTR